jgi:hypothetical protein
MINCSRSFFAITLLSVLLYAQPSNAWSPKKALKKAFTSVTGCVAGVRFFASPFLFCQDKLIVVYLKVLRSRSSCLFCLGLSRQSRTTNRHPRKQWTGGHSNRPICGAVGECFSRPSRGPAYKRVTLGPRSRRIYRKCPFRRDILGE